jgi:hypothetical protein
MILDQTMFNLSHRKKPAHLHGHRSHTVVHVNIRFKRNKLINHHRDKKKKRRHNYNSVKNIENQSNSVTRVLEVHRSLSQVKVYIPSFDKYYAVYVNSRVSIS